MGAGAIKSLREARAETVGQPHRNFREIQTGNSQIRRRVYARIIKTGGALDNAAPFAVQ